MGIFSIAFFYFNFNSDCEFYDYLTVRIFNVDKFTSVYNYDLKWEKGNEHLFTDEKNRVKEIEKSKL